MRSHALSLILLLSAGTLLAADMERNPNIIFIMADDLGYGDLGCYGQREIRTPNIDQMAREGMRFTQCYAGSTVCAPTRCVLMTGRHTGHARVRGNSGWQGTARQSVLVPLRPEDLTVAEVLKQAGYATCVTGKWGLGEPGTTGIPTRQGFDEWLGYLNQRHAHGYYPEYVWHNESMESLDGNLGGHQGEWIHTRFTDFALDFISKHHRRPFFLYLAYTIPHGRFEVPSDEPYYAKPWPQDLKNYAAMVTRLDGDVGRIMALLKDIRLLAQIATRGLAIPASHDGMRLAHLPAVSYSCPTYSCSSSGNEIRTMASDAWQLKPLLTPISLVRLLNRQKCSALHLRPWPQVDIIELVLRSHVLPLWSRT